MSAMDTISTDLAQLADLRDKGVLTQAEFDAEKARLLHPAATPATPAPIAAPTALPINPAPTKRKLPLPVKLLLLWLIPGVAVVLVAVILHLAKVI